MTVKQAFADPKIIAAIVAGLISGAGGTASYNTLFPPQPNPFTGSQASQLVKEVEDLQIRHERLDLIVREERPPKDLLEDVRENAIRIERNAATLEFLQEYCRKHTVKR